MNFIDKIAPYAQKVARDYNILASLIIAQACVESGYGKSGLAINANNLFGIKGSYNGKSVVMRTTEYKGDVSYHIMAPFRKYPTFLESLQDLGKLYKNGVSWDPKLYARVIGEKDYRKAAHIVRESKYCTLPTYAEELISVIESFKLYQYDAVVVPHPIQPVYYVVKPGDTVSGIALKHGVTVRQIASLSKLENQNFIVIGQKLRIK
jgi:flagellum-specific peptidoglycan hydrolase FlgJ